MPTVARQCERLLGSISQALSLSVCSDRRRYGTCKAPLVHLDELEAELAAWLATCHPDEQVDAAARGVVERGLRQRRTAAGEFAEGRSVKTLTARLERTTDLYCWGHIAKDDYQRERAVIWRYSGVSRQYQR